MVVMMSSKRVGPNGNSPINITLHILNMKMEIEVCFSTAIGKI
jgi:hypothetical protein